MHSFQLTCGSLRSRIITVRAGRTPEPGNDLLYDTKSCSQDDERMIVSSSASASPLAARDTQSKISEDMQMEDAEGPGRYDSFQFLGVDPVEEAGDDDNDSDYESESEDEASDSYEEYESVEIPVGFGEVFHIHEEVLRSSSAFFDTALRKQWAEGTSGRVDLPDVDAKAFGIYTEWLYTGVLRLSSALDMRRDCTEQEPFQIKTAE